MQIKWLGHACFLMTSDRGVKILTDPFKKDKNLDYPAITDTVDIVTVSHDHYDHNDASAVPGNPSVLKGSTEVVIKDVDVRTVSTWHDTVKGKERGANHIFCVTVDRIKICHLGDLGHRLAPDDLKLIGKVDVLMIPIGGVFTIDVDGANDVCSDIKPRVVLPMHYKTDRCQWLKFSVDDFTRDRHNVQRPNSCEIELSADSLPRETQTVVLNYAA